MKRRANNSGSSKDGRRPKTEISKLGRELRRISDKFAASGGKFECRKNDDGSIMGLCQKSPTVLQSAETAPNAKESQNSDANCAGSVTESLHLAKSR